MNDSDSPYRSLEQGNPGYPARLLQRQGGQAPPDLVALGNVELLALFKIALFCSVRCPGNAILAAHDTARKLRDEGVAVISGFQSPVEKECLRILLRGKQPIIICVARSLEKIRLPLAWRAALDARPPTIESARQRYELVAALSDEVLIIHATPGGQIERLSVLIDHWGLPLRNG